MYRYIVKNHLNLAETRLIVSERRNLSEDSIYHWLRPHKTDIVVVAYWRSLVYGVSACDSVGKYSITVVCLSGRSMGLGENLLRRKQEVALSRGISIQDNTYVKPTNRASLAMCRRVFGPTWCPRGWTEEEVRADERYAAQGL